MNASTYLMRHRGCGDVPWTIASVLGVLLALALGASWLPARLATRTSPASMLSKE